MKRHLEVVLLVALLVAVSSHGVDAQCAMCRRALDSPEGRQMIAAFRSGILLLLGAPFVVFGAVAGLAVRAHRRRSSGAAGDRADVNG